MYFVILLPSQIHQKFACWKTQRKHVNQTTVIKFAIEKVCQVAGDIYYSGMKLQKRKQHEVNWIKYFKISCWDKLVVHFLFAHHIRSTDKVNYFKRIKNVAQCKSKIKWKGFCNCNVYFCCLDFILPGNIKQINMSSTVVYIFFI